MLPAYYHKLTSFPTNNKPKRNPLFPQFINPVSIYQPLWSIHSPNHEDTGTFHPNERKLGKETELEMLHYTDADCLEVPRVNRPTGLQQLKTEWFNLWKIITPSILQGQKLLPTMENSASHGPSYCSEYRLSPNQCVWLRVTHPSPNQTSSHNMKSNILKLNMDDIFYL